MTNFQKILFILLLSACSCFGLSQLLAFGLISYCDTQVNKLAYIVRPSKTYHDLLLIGSSRTESGLNPAILDSIIGSNSYNMGIGGGTIIEFNAFYKAYLENHTPPKYLVLSIDKHSLDMHRGVVNHLLYYDYLNSKAIREMLEQHNKKISFKAWVFLTEVDDYYKGIAFKGLLGQRNGQGNDIQCKGFGQSSIADTHLEKNQHNVYVARYDNRGKVLLDEILTISQKNKTTVVMTYHPDFNYGQLENKHDKVFFDFITNKCRQNNIDFLRHDLLPLCQDESNFRNNSHLNNKGASLYTSYLGNILHEKFKNRK